MWTAENRERVGRGKLRYPASSPRPTTTSASPDGPWTRTKSWLPSGTGPQRWIYSTSLVLMVVAACAPIRSAKVADQINGMVGLSKEHVLSCMGPPQSVAQAGAIEVWAYNSSGAVNSSILASWNQSILFGTATTSQESCVVNLTMSNNIVISANYRSYGKLIAPSLPCYYVLHACVPNL